MTSNQPWVSVGAVFLNHNAVSSNFILLDHFRPIASTQPTAAIQKTFSYCLKKDFFMSDNFIWHCQSGFCQVLKYMYMYVHPIVKSQHCRQFNLVIHCMLLHCEFLGGGMSIQSSCQWSHLQRLCDGYKGFRIEITGGRCFCWSSVCCHRCKPHLFSTLQKGSAQTYIIDEHPRLNEFRLYQDAYFVLIRLLLLTKSQQNLM